MDHLPNLHPPPYTAPANPNTHPTTSCTSGAQASNGFRVIASLSIISFFPSFLLREATSLDSALAASRICFSVVWLWWVSVEPHPRNNWSGSARTASVVVEHEFLASALLLQDDLISLDGVSWLRFVLLSVLLLLVPFHSVLSSFLCLDRT